MKSGSATFDRSYFDNNYRNYYRQNPRWKLDAYAAVVEATEPRQGDVRILEVGCGLGVFLSHLRARDPDGSRWLLTGTDISDYAIDYDRERIEGVEFFPSKVEDLGSTVGGQYDLVLGFDVFEHVPDLEHAARSVTSVLRSDGTLIFVVPVYDGPLGVLVRIADRDPTHVHKMGRHLWLTWARRHFRQVEWFGIYRGLFPGLPYLHVLSQRGRGWAPAILVRARNKVE